MFAVLSASTVVDPVNVTTSGIWPIGKPIVLSVPLIDPGPGPPVTVVDPKSVPLVLRADIVNILPGVNSEPWKAMDVPTITVEGLTLMKG